MTIKFPTSIDDTTSIPILINNVDEVDAEKLNTLRSAVIAIESELGTSPGGVSGTVVNRLDGMDVLIASIAGGSGGGGGGGGGGGPAIPTGPAKNDLVGNYPAPFVQGIKGAHIPEFNPPQLSTYLGVISSGAISVSYDNVTDAGKKYMWCARGSDGLVRVDIGQLGDSDEPLHSITVPLKDMLIRVISSASGDGFTWALCNSGSESYVVKIDGTPAYTDEFGFVRQIVGEVARIPLLNMDEADFILFDATHHRIWLVGFSSGVNPAVAYINTANNTITYINSITNSFSSAIIGGNNLWLGYSDSSTSVGFIDRFNLTSLTIMAHINGQPGIVDPNRVGTRNLVYDGTNNRLYYSKSQGTGDILGAINTLSDTYISSFSSGTALETTTLGVDPINNIVWELLSNGTLYGISGTNFSTIVITYASTASPSGSVVGFVADITSFTRLWFVDNSTGLIAYFNSIAGTGTYGFSQFVFSAGARLGFAQVKKMGAYGADLIICTNSSDVVLNNINTIQSGVPRGRVTDVIREMTTTDATITNIYNWTLQNNAVTLTDVVVTAITSDGTAGASYKKSATFRNNAGTISLIGATHSNQVDENTSSWDVTIDVVGNQIIINVMGDPSKSVIWYLSARYQHVINT
jgi:hypothetical protein